MFAYALVQPASTNAPADRVQPPAPAGGEGENEGDGDGDGEEEEEEEEGEADALGAEDHQAGADDGAVEGAAEKAAVGAPDAETPSSSRHVMM